MMETRISRFFSLETPAGRLPAIVFILTAIAYLCGIMGHSFWAENEAYYTLGANSVLAGRFLLPTFCEGMPIDKPPLVCWWIALIAAPFGKVTEFTARLANVIPALVVVWLTFRFAAQNVSRTTATLAALILATSYLFWKNSIEVSTDLALLAFLVLCWCNLFAIMEQGFTWRRWVLVWISMGLGLLTKGPVAIVLSGLIACTFAISRYGWADGVRRLFRIRPVTGILLCLSPIAGWCTAVYFFHGLEPLKDIMFRQNITRYMRAFNHLEPWYYLIEGFPLNLLPWSLLLPLVVIQWIRRSRRGEDHGAWRWFCATCIVAVFVFFSLSSAKRHYYLLPLTPWMAVLFADSLESSLPGTSGVPSRRQTWGLVTGFLFLIIIGIVSLVAIPQLESRRSVIPFVRKAEMLSNPSEQLVFFGNEDPRIFYYLKKKFTFCEDTPAGHHALNNILTRPGVDVLFSRDVLETVKNVAGVPLYVEGSEKIRRKPYYIVTNVKSDDAAALTDDYVLSQQPGKR